ncbi:hypothetical protein GPECTOR_21g623 [Gonium pectorale]|uniref:Uncharacterized protein n=1 Tax=Gonium pectorale TaxID=33097 RepID=A0A150GHV5_GONPE|nr:hypothetical protein GPECTOR_21g623 [Gonium pectorale]|eukprot:KXZ49397.1 hypothetical protein GPECTOR_21g623 [Gonium pectorale]
MRPHKLAEALWGLARLGLQVPMPWLDAALHCLTAAPPSGIRLAATLRKGGAVEGSIPGSGGGGDGAAAAPAFGGVPTAGGCGGGGLAGLNAVQLTNAVWAVVELSAAAGREEVTRAWARPVFAATQGRLRRLTASQLVDLLWNVARGRRQPLGPWRTTAAAALAAAAPRLAPWQLARAAAALAKMRLASPYKLVAALLLSLRRRLDAATPADVAAMVWALRFITRPYTPVVVRRHRRDLRDLAAATLPCLPTLAPAQLVQLADGFAHLGVLPGVEWMRAHREACIRLRNRFTEANRRKVRTAYALMMSLS